MISFTINAKVDILSSKCRIYKTESVIKQAQGLVDSDVFISKIANSIIKNYIIPNNYLKAKPIADNVSFMISTADREHSLLIKFGYQIHSNYVLNIADVIVYKYIGKEKKGTRADRRFLNYINANSVYDVVVTEISDTLSNHEFLKLYLISNSDQVNFPLLNKEQKTIVTTEDKNILVQGVAGSGKTNVCIDKIVYSACRRYYGKTLYSTYSHGLLEDTKTKVDLFCYNIREFINNYELKNIEFLDSDHKTAIENKLGVWLDVIEDDKIIEKLKSIIDYLSNKVSYYLLEDLYRIYGLSYVKCATEQTFIKEYISNIKNYNISKNIEKIKYISYEVIYKEIYGLIFGCCDLANVRKVISQEEYIELRKDNFSRTEANIIYAIALDYDKFLERNNYVDNNIISKNLLTNIDKIEKYSIIVLDEVQDFTQANLCLFQKLGLKMFCVGDVLQMINPTYFSFAYLKRLMFDQETASVIELKHNYRNSKKIEELIDNLSALNIEQFGTHNFVLRGKSIESDVPTSTIYVNDGNFINAISQNVFNDLTIVVSTKKKKEELRKLVPKQEILTISEIKGLERTSIILLDVLSDSSDKWNALQRNMINKKKAEENSVYRYYFNLFYVGLSRAKQNLFVVERKTVDLFNKYFNDNFDVKTQKDAIDTLKRVVRTIDIDEDELIERINQFVKLEQYDNAKWTANKLPDSDEMNLQISRIDVFENTVRVGKHKEAGVKFWKLGLFEDAKTQFKLSGDEKLIELINACIENNGQKLEYDIVQFYPDVMDNTTATEIILSTLKDDLKNLSDSQRKINISIKKKKELNYGTK